MEKAKRVRVPFALRLRDQRSMWMQDGCKVCMDSYVASKGPCFMVTWAILKNHPLEVGLTQNQETIALWLLTIVWFILIYHVWGPAWTEIHQNSIWWRAPLRIASYYIWGSMTTLHDLGGLLGRLLYHAPWSRILKCIVKSYATKPSTKCYFNEFVYMRIPHTW